MFSEKVMLTIPKERKVIKKRIGGKEIQMYASMSEEEIIYCLQTCVSTYYEDNFISNQDAFVTPLELFANLDISTIQLCTNIDVQNIAFEDLCVLNIHNFLRDNLGGFTMLEDAIMVSIQHIHTLKMLEGFDHVASIDELEESAMNVQSVLEEGQSEQMRELLAAQIANNPTIRDFYEKYAKTIEESKDVSNE